MAFDGFGNFLRLHNWTQDAANNIDINAGEMDGEDNGFAAGLSLAVTRDGQGKMGADYLPATDNVYNLGTAVARWKSINNVAIAPLSNLGGDIRNYGGISGTDAGAAIQASAAANALVIIPAGTWPIAAVPAIPVGVIMQALPGSVFSGAGAATMGFSAGTYNQMIEYNTPLTDYATNFYFRNANHTGGTPGNTLSSLNVRTNVGAGVANYEWAFLSVLNNSATGGQNVAGYMQGNRQTSGAGPTWAAVAEVREVVPIANPTHGLVGLEVDNRSNGTDTAGNRIGIDVVCTRYNTSGAATTVTFGVRVQSNLDGANSIITNAFSAYQCTTAFAFDCANATVTSGSLRMAQAVPILFDGAGVNQLMYNGSGLDYLQSGTIKNRLLASGGLQVLTNQVVGAQIAGYGTPTGASRISSFPGATATLLQTSQMLAALMADLKVHGLIAS